MKLSVSIYNALISGLDKAQKIDSFMRRNGCKPDLVTYNIHLNYYCNNVMLDEAKKFIKIMETGGICPG